MCLVFMSFRAPSSALKQKNYHNSANTQPIIPLFQVLFKFMKRHISICVWDMIKQSKPLQTRYDTTYIYDRYSIRTHVYVSLFSVKKTRV